MKKLLGVTAVIEAVTGLALVIQPPLLSYLLLGEGISGAGVPPGRVGGFELLSLGLACEPYNESAAVNIPALRALLAYNLLATLFLAYLGIAGAVVGIMLWPAVVLHAVLTILLARAWFAFMGLARVK